MKKTKVENLEGEKEPFSSEKVYLSAKNAGASKELAEEVARRIEKKVYPNIKTSKIYQEVKNILREKDYQSSLKFDLKVAMKKLGPTGFPFEKYVKSILQKSGFKIKINLYIKGKCCTYEIDFLAENKEIVYIGECKYRNLLDSSVGINFALINYARFLDLKNGNFLNQFSKLKIKSILVTNAKFSTSAIKYSNCVGSNLLGWKYPQNNGLEKIIEDNKLYPITILPSLSKEMASVFTKKRKMLAKDVLNIKINEFSKQTNLSVNSLEKIKQEAEILLKK